MLCIADMLLNPSVDLTSTGTVPVLVGSLTEDRRILGQLFLKDKTGQIPCIFLNFKLMDLNQTICVDDWKLVKFNTKYYVEIKSFFIASEQLKNYPYFEFEFHSKYVKSTNSIIETKLKQGISVVGSVLSKSQIMVSGNHYLFIIKISCILKTESNCKPELFMAYITFKSIDTTLPLLNHFYSIKLKESFHFMNMKSSKVKLKSNSDSMMSLMFDCGISIQYPVEPNSDLISVLNTQSNAFFCQDTIDSQTPSQKNGKDIIIESVICYKGTVTDVLDLTMGIYVIDNTHQLHLTYHNLSGTELELNNVHIIPDESQSFIYFIACPYSTITICRFSDIKTVPIPLNPIYNPKDRQKEFMKFKSYNFVDILFRLSIQKQLSSIENLTGCPNLPPNLAHDIMISCGYTLYKDNIQTTILSHDKSCFLTKTRYNIPRVVTVEDLHQSFKEIESLDQFNNQVENILLFVIIRQNKFGMYWLCDSSGEMLAILDQNFEYLNIYNGLFVIRKLELFTNKSTVTNPTINYVRINQTDVSEVYRSAGPTTLNQSHRFIFNPTLISPITVHFSTDSKTGELTTSYQSILQGGLLQYPNCDGDGKNCFIKFTDEFLHIRHQIQYHSKCILHIPTSVTMTHFDNVAIEWNGQCELQTEEKKLNVSEIYRDRYLSVERIIDQSYSISQSQALISCHGKIRSIQYLQSENIYHFHDSTIGKEFNTNRYHLYPFKVVLVDDMNVEKQLEVIFPFGYPTFSMIPNSYLYLHQIQISIINGKIQLLVLPVTEMNYSAQFLFSRQLVDLEAYNQDFTHHTYLTHLLSNKPSKNTWITCKIKNILSIKFSLYCNDCVNANCECDTKELVGSLQLLVEDSTMESIVQIDTLKLIMSVLYLTENDLDKIRSYLYKNQPLIDLDLSPWSSLKPANEALTFLTGLSDQKKIFKTIHFRISGIPNHITQRPIFKMDRPTSVCRLDMLRSRTGRIGDGNFSTVGLKRIVLFVNDLKDLEIVNQAMRFVQEIEASLTN
ncbi:hypothetical protein HDV02_002532 [Globomyces sp. JEL0801]|nr:hypothetical protein HDV02_002532 [Globomyces sp. JEL0801]